MICWSLLYDMGLCFQKVKWRKEFKKQHTPFPSADVAVFSLLINLYLFHQNVSNLKYGKQKNIHISKTEHHFFTLETLMNVGETSVPYKANLLQSCQKHFPITRKRDKRETGYVFKCHLSDCKSWIYLPWRGTSPPPFRFLLQVRAWSGLTAGPAKPSPVALIIQHDPVLNVSNTKFLPLFYIYKTARFCRFNTDDL